MNRERWLILYCMAVGTLGWLWLLLSGRLDAVRTDTAIAQVHAAIADGVRKVLLDLSDVTFLSSSGLRALLLMRKELLAHDGELRLCALRPEVQEVFALTGFTQVFTIHRSRAEALDGFKREEGRLS